MSRTFFVLAFALAAPRSACVTCGPTPSSAAPMPEDRFGDVDSQRRREQEQWERALPSGGAARPGVTSPSPIAVGGAAAAGLGIGVAAVGVAAGAGDDAGPPLPPRDSRPMN